MSKGIYTRKGLLLSFFIFILFTTISDTLAVTTSIKANQLIYDTRLEVLYLSGDVLIKRDDITITADEVEFLKEISLLRARGNVIYDDKNATIKASYIELNLDKKKGKIKRAKMLFKAGEEFQIKLEVPEISRGLASQEIFKSDEYYLTGNSIIKKGEGSYFIEDASFTMCETKDNEIPVWCIKSKKAEITDNEVLTAKGVTLNIKGVPEFYTPYIQIPLKRRSGFLTPIFGFGKNSAFSYTQPYYWVLRENRDVTFYLETRFKEGFGAGLEYRYVQKGDIRGNWFFNYRDDDLNNEKIYRLKGNRSQLAFNKFTTNINIDYVNTKNYYEDNVMSRFIESNGEIAYSTEKTRYYIISRYLSDLSKTTNDISHKLPEIGFVVNPFEAGPVKLSLDSTLTNFWSKDGISALRFDLIPKIFHSIGSNVRLTQTGGVRTTLYSFFEKDPVVTGNEDNQFYKGFEYAASIDTTLRKRYFSFLHVIDPSIRYIYRFPNNNAPIFDSVELFDEASNIEVSMINYFMDNGGSFFQFRLSNLYDLNEDDKPFGPLKVEAFLEKPISLKSTLLYDFNENAVNEFNTLIKAGFDFWDFRVNFGQTYKKLSDEQYYTIDTSFKLLKNLKFRSSILFNAQGKDEGVRNLGANLIYTRQCWSFNTLFDRAFNKDTPDTYKFLFVVQLKGLGGFGRFNWGYIYNDTSRGLQAGVPIYYPSQ